MKASTQEWLNFAKADLRNCEKIMDDEFLSHIVVFHSQQAVEKCLKAFIEERGLNIPRVHSLIKLYTLIESELSQAIETRELLSLDNVYTSSRYPTEIGMMATGKPSQTEALALYESAKKIFEFLCKEIGD